MMGHINNLLIRMVEKHHGPDGVSRLFALAGKTQKQYQPEVVYSEAEFQALYRAAKELYGVDDEAAQRAFSDYFMEVSPVMFPAVFKFAGSVFKYDSPNHLCGVLRFVAEGVLAHYREKGTVTETQCARRGAPWCEIEVRFEST